MDEVIKENLSLSQVQKSQENLPIEAIQFVPNGVKWTLASVNSLDPGHQHYQEITLTDGANVSLDVSLGSVFILTAAGDRTLLAPTNPKDHYKIIIKHIASGANRTLTFTTGAAGAFRFGSTIASMSTTVSGKTDYIGCIYNSTDDRWDIVSISKGY